MNRGSARRALLIGVAAYESPDLAPLPSARADVDQLADVLEHPERGQFDDVRRLIDPTRGDCINELTTLFDDSGPGDLVLVYVSGHGTRMVETTGEFFFAARDSDLTCMSETGLGASWVNDHLELCGAAQKVVILDTCYSGGFALGLRTTDAKETALPATAPPLVTRGVYVLSSSGVAEPSYAGVSGPDGPEPSAFTGVLVDALKSGVADRDADGRVSVDELFEHVNGVLRAEEGPRRQVAVKSSYGVDGRIVLARAPAHRAGAGMKCGASGAEAAPTPAGQITWDRLLAYYRRCVRAEAQGELLDLDAGSHAKDSSASSGSYVCLRGSERLVCGAVDESGSVAVPSEATDLVEAAKKEGEDDIVCGYPVVSFRQGRKVVLGPLLTRRVSIVDDGKGGQLRIAGGVTVHPEVVRRLGGDEAVDDLEHYQSSWRAGEHHRMVVDLRYLFADLGVTEKVELEPSALDESIGSPTGEVEIHNSAILMRASAKSPNARLLEDLSEIAAAETDICDTALASLQGDPTEDLDLRSSRWVLATPWTVNAAQRAVIDAAMTRRLTVATGPPGTGKSQLVANLVATAVANGQSVLVASTNNRAVDEVRERCDRVREGMLVRTGAASGGYHVIEADTLEALANGDPPTGTIETAWAQLAHATRAREEAGACLARIAESERAAANAAQVKGHLAAQLGTAEDVVAARLRRGSAQRTRSRAGRLARARFLGELRRGRFLSGLELDGEGRRDRCRDIDEFLAADHTWIEAAEELGRGDSDDQLRKMLAVTDEQLTHASKCMVDAVVAQGAAAGAPLLSDLAKAARNRNGTWGQRLKVLQHVRGWAVSALSAREFPPRPGLFDLVVIDEASQCSIPAVIPLLFRARRALLVGDAMQLRHIAPLSAEGERTITKASGIDGEQLAELRLDHRANSAFDAFTRAAGGHRMLLDEHYRCHPAIADIANRRFYEGDLTVLTDVEALSSADGLQPLRWVDVRGTARRGRDEKSWVNHDEAEEVERLVERLLRELPDDATVGVVTPFAAQANRLTRAGWSKEKVRVGTVHTFQGGERDAMVFSLVASRGMPPGTMRWLQSGHDLWNVAITRAKAHLMIVGDATHWRHAGGLGGALLQSLEPHGRSGAPVDDEDLFRLYQRASETGAEVELAAEVNGYLADALVRSPAGVTAVRLDRPTSREDPESHLRRELRRAELLASTSAARAGIRVPLWRLYDGAALPLEPAT